MAFDPDFKTNGKLYTYSTAPTASATADKPDPFLTSPSEADHQGVLSEWHVDPNNPDRVDPASRKELLRWDHPNFNHNGGHIAFGPDRMLYMSDGDGGGADDQNGQEAGPGNTTRGKAARGNGQNNTVIMGKILRIDPNGTNSANGKYGIPADNPFAGQAGKGRGDLRDRLPQPIPLQLRPRHRKADRQRRRPDQRRRSGRGDQGRELRLARQGGQLYL